MLKKSVLNHHLYDFQEKIVDSGRFKYVIIDLKMEKFLKFFKTRLLLLLHGRMLQKIVDEDDHNKQRAYNAILEGNSLKVNDLSKDDDMRKSYEKYREYCMKWYVEKRSMKKV